ncbi:glycerophosphoryl diester phosphodiesterase membrane domain-containing protein [Porphyrobacter sp. HT-58-2]|uniref:glycerophosphoryl diester phosphodiesterase membrane domain-containing protein n=1 Tax=Porphyrobacter sp. HT-58-2 TaxID=2023229 RepID=UPI0011B02E97|nr:glycerophosphoryl diester phosphodiesterase membrane domain-containing protein [Porphyrobacter sp. HT-58-2]
MVDIGRVFSTSFAMFRQRFWLLLGMWAVFFAIQTAASMVLGIGLGAAGLAGAAALGSSGFDDPAAMDDMGVLAGLGIGMILFMVLFYGAYIVILLAQQAAMVTLASPLEEPMFGLALRRGFKSALPFIGIALLLLLAYAAMMVASLAVAGAVGAVAGGSIGGVAGTLLIVLAALYLACRFAVLVPVVAVDEVYNPVTAIRRSWAVTQGKALSILLALLGFGAITLVVLGVPLLMIIGAATGLEGGGEPSGGAIAVIIIAGLALIPLFMAYSIYASAFTASLHVEVTDGGAERLEEVFA